MYDWVDIGEKRFYLNRKKESYCILIADHNKGDDKGDVYRTVRNANHLTMVMFLCA
jgi:hypothetical protein